MSETKGIEQRERDEIDRSDDREEGRKAERARKQF
jgi:hypothetical protein